MCRSCRASNRLSEEQRANLSTPRLGHQTGRNQPLRREEEGDRRGSEVAVAGGTHFLWRSCASSPIRSSVTSNIYGEKTRQALNVRQSIGWYRHVKVEQKMHVEGFLCYTNRWCGRTRGWMCRIADWNPWLLKIFPRDVIICLQSFLNSEAILFSMQLTK